MTLPNFSFLFRGADGDDSGVRRRGDAQGRARKSQGKSDTPLGAKGSDAPKNDDPSGSHIVQADSSQRMSRRNATSLPDGIVARLRARDAAAFAELVERLGPELTTFAAQMVQSEDAAKDVVQDVLYHIWQQAEQFDPKGPLVAYLYATVRNRALKVLRHDRIVQRSHGVLRASGDGGITSPEAGADLQLEVAEDTQRLDLALAKLTQHQRTAFALRYYQELTIAEIATVLEISEKGVERLMTRVRRLLRDYFLETQ